jgi:hypothetical protein
LKTRQAAFQRARGKLRGPEFLTNFPSGPLTQGIISCTVTALVWETRSRRAGRRNVIWKTGVIA